MDAACLQEINLNLSQISTKANLYAQCRRSRAGPSKWVAAWNTNTTNQNQVLHGGCMLIARNKLLPRIIATEKNPSGLGRWISQLVEGKGDHKA